MVGRHAPDDVHQVICTKPHAPNNKQKISHKAWRQVHRLWPVLAVTKPHVHLLQVDFVEVYQDQVRDLLINPNEDGTTRMPAIDIRESPTQGVFLEGVRYVAIALPVTKIVRMLL